MWEEHYSAWQGIDETQCHCGGGRFLDLRGKCIFNASPKHVNDRDLHTCTGTVNIRLSVKWNKWSLIQSDSWSLPGTARIASDRFLSWGCTARAGSEGRTFLLSLSIFTCNYSDHYDVFSNLYSANRIRQCSRKVPLLRGSRDYQRIPASKAGARRAVE